MTTTYRDAVHAHDPLSAPQPVTDHDGRPLAPFTAFVELAAGTGFRALVVDTQGQPVKGGLGAWWCDRRLASIQAHAMRLQLLLERARVQ